MLRSVYRIQRGDLVEIKEIKNLIFYNGDCYILDAGLILWIWLGSQSSVDERFSAIYYASKIKEERGGIPVISNVEEGNEPQKFLDALPNELTVTEGGIEGILRDPLGKKAVHLPALFHYTSEGILEEIPLKKKSLKTNRFCVLDTGLVIFVWVGKKAKMAENRPLESVFSPRELGDTVDPGRKFTPHLKIVEEGKEPKKFWQYFQVWDS